MGFAIAAGVVALIGILTAPVFGGTQITVSATTLRIELVGLDKVWAMRSRLVIPIDHVVSAEVRDPRELSAGWRLPGTAIPGWITAGRYVRKGSAAFWNVRRARQVLVLRLRGEPFDEVVVQVDEPAALAKEISGRLRQSPSEVIE